MIYFCNLMTKFSHYFQPYDKFCFFLVIKKKSRIHIFKKLRFMQFFDHICIFSAILWWNSYIFCNYLMKFTLSAILCRNMLFLRNLFSKYAFSLHHAFPMHIHLTKFAFFPDPLMKKSPFSILWQNLRYFDNYIFPFDPLMKIAFSEIFWWKSRFSKLFWIKSYFP